MGALLGTPAPLCRESCIDGRRRSSGGRAERAGKPQRVRSQSVLELGVPQERNE